MNSLDPRVNRLPEIGEPGHIEPRADLDQFGTFEVFVQPKEEKPFQHEGIVHAPNLEMAYILAKETFTRRFTCVSLYVVATQHVAISPMTEGNKNAYDLIAEITEIPGGENMSYEIYHLPKRGKQQVHVGTLEAPGPKEALAYAKQKFNTGKPVCNVWAIRTQDILFTSPKEKDLWLTLPEKKFRDAAEYKGGDKLKEFLNHHQKSS